MRKALAVHEASASKTNQDSEILVARAQFKLATVVEDQKPRKPFLLTLTLVL